MAHRAASEPDPQDIIWQVAAAAADSCFCQSVFLAGATRNPGKLDMLIKNIQTLQWSDSNCDAVLLARMGRLAHVVQLHVA